MCSSCWLVIFFFSSQRLRTAKTSIFFSLVKKKRKSLPPIDLLQLWSDFSFSWRLVCFHSFMDLFSQLIFFLFWQIYQISYIDYCIPKKIITYTLFSSSSRLNALATPSARQFRIAHTKTHLSFFLLLYCISDLYTQNCIFIFSHPSSVCFQKKINNHINNLSTHP